MPVVVVVEEATGARLPHLVVTLSASMCVLYVGQCYV